ncbi:hypothetical protein CHS0354_033823 [Potamilus streckersoni]|uniref:Fatty acid desaturase domain-containing protein n=1 Tax=Potamilus streckersoni TaxID=2493646 RepID=A0AAE0T7T9_9BIVA|nr:hypothetical protein CHS0354_033823 [Potamilus streckersoni]
MHCKKLVDIQDETHPEKLQEIQDEVHHREMQEMDDQVLEQNYPTILQVKSAIPKRFFKANICVSLYFFFRDIAMIVGLYMVISYTQSVLPMFFICLLTPVYWLLQGAVFTGMFVLGHDCGHGSFSRYRLINDIVGTIAHTFVLTPYYPWKLSHRNHHKHTGNMDKDEVFYPHRDSDRDGKGYTPLFGLGFGWFYYLVKGYRPRAICHFKLNEAMFSDHVTKCALSLVAMFGWGCCLLYYINMFGFLSLAYYYLVPEAIFASWVVILTFLHHNEENVPWFSDDTWTFVKGQLSSIDRDYGWANSIIHNIGTHQIHHLFPKIPHYHLEEATVYFRNAFPHLVRKRYDPILPSFLRMFRKFDTNIVTSKNASIHIYK